MDRSGEDGQVLVETLLSLGTGKDIKFWYLIVQFLDVILNLFFLFLLLSSLFMSQHRVLKVCILMHTKYFD